MNNQSFSSSTLETIQWFVFLLASSVALPIVIGAIYQLDFVEVSGLMQRTFFHCWSRLFFYKDGWGISSLLWKDQQGYG